MKKKFIPFKSNKAVGLFLGLLLMVIACTKDIDILLIKVEGIEIDALTTELEVNNTLQLGVVITPDDAKNKNVTWKSSDTSIATVNEAGLVTGIASGEVDITVISVDSPEVSKSITLKVLSTTNEITSFRINNIEGIIIEDNEGNNVTINLPEGTNVEKLTPIITHNGASIEPASGVERNFSEPVTYTVVAENGDTREYIVSVVLNLVPVTSIEIDSESTSLVAESTLQLEAIVAPENATNKKVFWNSSDPKIATVDENGLVTGVTPGTVTITATAQENGEIFSSIELKVVNTSAAITSFKINDIEGVINGTSIKVTFPAGSDVNIAKLTPVITHNGASIKPASGVERDFTQPVTYTVVAENGDTLEYIVTVVVLPPLSGTNDITSFTINNIEGSIENNSITVKLPANTDVTKLKPIITHNGASIEPASDVERNFTQPVTYTVVAENGDTLEYIVTVVVLPPLSGTNDITSFTINNIEGNIENNSITVKLPANTDVTKLTPIITHNGASIEPASNVERDFTQPVTYTVVAENGDTREYIVSVVLNSVPVTSIEIDSESTSLVAESTLQLETVVAPENATNKKVLWSSSDPKIATVDENGLVTGVTPGTVTITATAQENDEIFSSIELRVLGIILSMDSTTFESGLSVKKQIDVKILLEDEDDSTDLTWTSSDPNTATVDVNGGVTGKNKGIVTITAIAVNFPELTASIELTITEDDFVITINGNKAFLPIPDNATYADNRYTLSELINGYDYKVDWDNDGIYDDFILHTSASYNYPAGGGLFKTIRISGSYPGPFFSMSEGMQESLIAVRQWGTGKWKSMKGAFEGCKKLVIGFPTKDKPNLSEVVSLERMFKGLTRGNPDVSLWDVHNVETMASMFYGAIEAQPDVSRWNTRNLKDMKEMFYGAIKADPDTSAWDMSSFESDSDTKNTFLDMFHGSGLSTANFEGFLIRLLHFTSTNEKLAPSNLGTFPVPVRCSSAGGQAEAELKNMGFLMKSPNCVNTP